jgi:hypothetical protein
MGTTGGVLKIVARQEPKTIVTQDVIPDLLYMPRSPESVIMILAGVPQTYGIDFIVIGKGITWSFLNANVHVAVGDSVYFIYTSSE